MKEFENNEELLTAPGKQAFKVVVTTTGSVTMQFQASDEGFNDIKDGSYSATDDDVVMLGTGLFRVVLTGDARFFMG